MLEKAVQCYIIMRWGERKEGDATERCVVDQERQRFRRRKVVICDELRLKCERTADRIVRSKRGKSKRREKVSLFNYLPAHGISLPLPHER